MTTNNEFNQLIEDYILKNEAVLIDPELKDFFIKNIQISEGVAGDYDGVLPLWVSLQQLHSDLDPFFKLADDFMVNKEYFKEIFNYWLENDSIFFQVVKFNDLIVAYSITIIRNRQSYYLDKKTGTFSEIFVNNILRKCGVGRKLVIKSSDFFKKHKIKHISVGFLKSNESGKKFWQGIGFNPKLLSYMAYYSKFQEHFDIEKDLQNSVWEVHYILDLSLEN